MSRMPRWGLAVAFSLLLHGGLAAAWLTHSGAPARPPLSGTTLVEVTVSGLPVVLGEREAASTPRKTASNDVAKPLPQEEAPEDEIPQSETSEDNTPAAGEQAPAAEPTEAQEEKTSGGASGERAYVTADYSAAFLANPKPAYPFAARRQGVEGRVVITAQVSETGDNQGVELTASSGHGSLDQAALAAVRRWRFVPAQAGGQPVAARIHIPVVFRLEPAS